MKKMIFAFVVVAATVASCTKKAAPASDANAIDSVAMFSKNCARCHGAEGVKDDRTPNLQTIPLDKAGLVKSITFGKGHMPAFQDKLSEAEISAIADLIVSWHKQ